MAMVPGNKAPTPPTVTLKHLAAAMEQARQIQTLDAQGEPSTDGKIVLISIGMSNTTQEFTNFMARAAADPKVNHTTLAIVDGEELGRGSGKTKKAAEQSAAERALERLEEHGR